jgi:hypothetical protein
MLSALQAAPLSVAKHSHAPFLAHLPLDVAVHTVHHSKAQQHKTSSNKKLKVRSDCAAQVSCSVRRAACEWMFSTHFCHSADQPLTSNCCCHSRAVRLMQQTPACRPLPEQGEFVAKWSGGHCVEVPPDAPVHTLQVPSATPSLPRSTTQGLQVSLAAGLGEGLHDRHNRTVVSITCSA